MPTSTHKELTKMDINKLERLFWELYAVNPADEVSRIEKEMRLRNVAWAMDQIRRTA